MNTWFHCVKYHNFHFKYYRKFITDELNMSKAPPESIEKLHLMLSDDATSQEIEVTLSFISDKCEMLLYNTSIFESKKPLSCYASEHMEDM